MNLLARGDAEGVLTAAYALSRPATVCAPLTTGADSRVTWGGEESEGPGVDVTELGHQYRTFGDARLMNRLTRAVAERGRLLLEGRLVLPGQSGPAPGTPSPRPWSSGPGAGRAPSRSRSMRSGTTATGSSGARGPTSHAGCAPSACATRRGTRG